ncbi:SDR family NAD(P)-dependent oxidoreductase [Streptomyces sp. NPDC057199]|uniref:SDR family NAD(P)-dependent oxidoreductase n=1 Tax=Streptomyces sp. NPDC057199 TaxID=3346047 RepID=UPI00362CB46C
MSNRLSGKVAVVTGGAGGLGSATCRRLVAEGARVVVADINGPAAKMLAEELGESATGYEFDYRDEGSVRSLIDHTVEQYGRIDLLHNNAVGGAAAGADGQIAEADPATWDAVYEISVRGYMLASKHAIPHMKEQQSGVIVNMASGSALKGDLMLSAYGTLKAAVITLSQYIATQYGKDGIRSISICPGAMLTDSMRNAMGPEGVKMMERHHLTPRLGAPSDLAALVAYLTSDESEFVTGINIPIDGGLLAHNPTVADQRG